MAKSPYPPFVGNTTEADKLDRALEGIARSLRNRSAQFLFGAGMSCESGIPAGSTLAEKLLEQFFPRSGTNPPAKSRLSELASSFPFEALVEAVQNSLLTGRKELTEILAGLLLDTKFRPAQAHRDFASILYEGGEPKLHSIFTTNFDFLLEDTIGRARSETVTEDNADMIHKAQETGKIPVIHLHGTLEKNCQITETDLFERNHSIVKTEFATALHTHDAFVFVGYSMNDPDFRRIYMEYRQDFEDRHRSVKRTCLVSRARDEFSWRFGSAIWEARKVVWFPLDAGAFFDRLKSTIETHTDREIRKKVMEKYDLADEAALDEYLQRTAAILRVSQDDALQFLYEIRTRSGGGHADPS